MPLTDPVGVSIVEEVVGLHIEESGIIRHHPLADLILVQAPIPVLVQVVIKVSLFVLCPLR